MSADNTQRILEPTEGNLRHAADWLAAGHLVAFPTETVYGLGGNALADDSVKKIYATKGRPATDPLICHMNTLEKAVALWDPEWDPAAIELASSIGSALWPGPLTIVCKAHPNLPASVTGGSGFVGSRIPRHPVALELLGLLDFPLAGPSANTFGHVSPTTPQHVYDDLASRDPSLLILDGGSCAVGIESTVIKVNGVEAIEVLRRGQVTVSKIQETIAAKYPNTRVDIRDTRSKFKGLDQPMDGPGQMLTHYAPGVPCSLVTPASVPATASLSSHANSSSRVAKEKETIEGERWCVQRGGQMCPMARTVILDYGGTLSRFEDSCLAYRDLSAAGNAGEACSAVFEALRWTERLAGAEAAIFPLLSEWSSAAKTEEEKELLAAVEDRLFRAASGTVALIKPVRAPS